MGGKEGKEGLFTGLVKCVKTKIYMGGTTPPFPSLLPNLLHPPAATVLVILASTNQPILLSCYVEHLPL